VGPLGCDGGDDDDDDDDDDGADDETGSADTEASDILLTGHRERASLSFQ